MLALVVSAAIFFVREWLRADWVALPLLVALGVSGVLTPQATLSGFSRSAEGVRVNLRAFALAVAYGCSLAFLTPLGHPANVLVMGPGGYKFADYFRVGFALTVILIVLIIGLLSLGWGG